MTRAPAKLKVTTPNDLQIVMTREFDASRRLVWDAMTKPELIRRWMFCPPGWTWAECTMDVRVGGRFRWAWNGPDGKLALSISGEHREVTPPKKIVHTERMEMGPGAGACGPECEGGEPGEVLVTLELDEGGKKTGSSGNCGVPVDGFCRYSRRPESHCHRVGLRASPARELVAAQILPQPSPAAPQPSRKLPTG